MFENYYTTISSPYRNQNGRILPAEMKGQVQGDPRRKYNEHDRNDLEIKKVQSNCEVVQPR